MEPAECVWVSRHKLLTGGYPTHIHCLKLYLNCTTLHQYYSALHCTRLHFPPSSPLPLGWKNCECGVARRGGQGPSHPTHRITILLFSSAVPVPVPSQSQLQSQSQSDVDQCRPHLPPLPVQIPTAPCTHPMASPPYSSVPVTRANWLHDQCWVEETSMAGE